MARSYPLQFSLYIFIFVYLQSISLLYSTVYKLRLDAALCLRPCYTLHIYHYYSLLLSQLQTIEQNKHNKPFNFSLLSIFSFFILLVDPPDFCCFFAFLSSAFLPLLFYHHHYSPQSTLSSLSVSVYSLFSLI